MLWYHEHTQRNLFTSTLIFPGKTTLKRTVYCIKPVICQTL
jgi:hypothetical protein